MKNKLISSIFLLIFSFTPAYGAITPAVISSEQAVELAINKLKPTATGLHLSHPQHSVDFVADGIHFQPRSGPAWSWELEHIGNGDVFLLEINQGTLRPSQASASIINYPRGLISEQYHLHQGNIEQRFIISEPLALHSQDLIISGRVASYPVTIDPVIAANDFRISDMGSDGNTSYVAFGS